ncbi:outer envelope pore protein 21, chloroplastic isoform X2 [Amborella trichopoda]|uniref:outer envelope pore protein 21, chloroplastic isoform X2 n=1 Tax=Amborella trichopoda TaxID=13333 RepID=UPI0005D2F492|nr:outer envelope pore protein 21, chloroplastic isoform X2 [Amborella trichopoda]|eukprot:XP_011627523.1 outer envelope pore protein 21, chloroplastic isoform X2 [Amborella trichopoda]
MDTSLRYGSDGKALCIHAKKDFPISSDLLFQVHGIVDTKTGNPTCLARITRDLLSELADTRVGFGVRYGAGEKLAYNVRGRAGRPITSSGMLSLDIKGRYDADKDLTEVPYFQIRENNWTLNADGNGKWNVRYDL